GSPSTTRCRTTSRRRSPRPRTSLSTWTPRSPSPRGPSRPRRPFLRPGRRRGLSGAMPDAIPLEVRAALRADLLPGSIGVFLVALGLLALALWLSRRRERDRALLFFSLLTVFYGARLLAATAAARLLCGLSAAGAAWFQSVVSYLLLVLFGLFGEQITAPQRRRVLGILWRVALLWAVAATLYEVSTGRPGAA